MTDASAQSPERDAELAPAAAEAREWMLDEAVCHRAMQSRDPRFDGRFFIGVLTTGVFCRPVCPARTPRPGNVRFYPTAAAAQDAGFRPCLRCKPETARRVPEWSVASDAVVRALRLIDAGYLNDRAASQLAEEIGLSTRQLNRLFRDHLGTTPLSVARMQRLQIARRLIDSSHLTLASVAMHAGYGSVRRFNDEFRRVYRCPPSALRRAAHKGQPTIELKLPVTEPYDRGWMIGFLAARRLPGVEEVSDDVYQRSLPLQGGGHAWLRARFGAGCLELEIPADTAEPVSRLVPRIRRVFDLDADGAAIQAHLEADPELGQWARSRPGLRVPGAWDGFETAVRAVLGQQVSVERARRLATAMIERYGQGRFPSPGDLVDADVSEIGMPGNRGEAVRQLAAAVLDGRVALDECQSHAALTEELCALRGVGPWTAGYIAMRVVKHPDAFLESDWVVLKVLDCKPAEARRRAEAWRPWRAYALMLLWWASSQARTETRGT